MCRPYCQNSTLNSTLYKLILDNGKYHPMRNIRYFTLSGCIPLIFKYEACKGSLRSGGHASTTYRPAVLCSELQWMYMCIHRDPIKMHPFCLGLYFRK